MLKDRFAENKFSDKRMIAAVNNVIDNYEGWDKIPNIANFISYDKKIKYFTWNEANEIGHKYLVCVDLGFPKPRWVRTEDFETYKLKKWDSNARN